MALKQISIPVVIFSILQGYGHGDFHCSEILWTLHSRRNQQTSLELCSVVKALRGGSNDRDAMEAKIREERAREAERFQKAKEAQARKKMEKEQAAMKQLAIKEEEEARNQLIQKRKRKLPEVLTLENLSRYAKDLLEDREYDQAVEAYRRVLLVDPYDVNALYDLGYIMQGCSHISNSLLIKIFLSLPLWQSISRTWSKLKSSTKRHWRYDLRLNFCFQYETRCIPSQHHTCAGRPQSCPNTAAASMAAHAAPFRDECIRGLRRRNA